LSKQILTIDLEDLYHSSLGAFNPSYAKYDFSPNSAIVTNTLKCLELLKKTKNTATFFVLACVCENFPDLVKEIIKEGHEVASHGYLHKLIYRMTPQEFEYDLKKSLEILSKTGVKSVKGYRAPCWSIVRQSIWALEIIKKCGFVYDSSIFPIRRKFYGIPEAPTKPHLILPNLWEFPPATIRLFGQNIPIAGGGYLRFIPYKLISKAIENYKDNEMGVFYFHLCELDPNNIRSRFKVRFASNIIYWLLQNIGWPSNLNKIERLISSYDFCSVAEAFPFLENKIAV